MLVEYLMFCYLSNNYNFKANKNQDLDDDDSCIVTQLKKRIVIGVEYPGSREERVENRVNTGNLPNFSRFWRTIFPICP